jgi:hypothetical protein
MHFHVHAWITVSQEYKLRNVLLGLLRSFTSVPDGVSELTDDQHLAEVLYRNLKGKRYLIVLDAMWNTDTRNVLKPILPLKAKSDVHSIFLVFQKLVENTFNSKIVLIYTDGGGEFQALKSFFRSHGINHLQTPPHTPQHNGAAERRHRHLVETGLTLLQTASFPSKYWSYAFQTAVYLINRLPTPIL